jgi:dTDP-4-amino-4,6-dideoxygalactose transaminase
MLIGHDKEQLDKARFYSTQARDPAPHYEHTEIGYNYRMSNIVAAIGRGQLTTIEERVAARRALFDSYKKMLGDLPGVSFMPEPDWGRSNRWLTCMVIDQSKANTDREKIRLALDEDNIESRPLWKPMHLQPVFSDAPAYTSGVSEELFAHGLCLPSGTGLTKEDVDRVVEIIKKTFAASV